MSKDEWQSVSKYKINSPTPPMDFGRAREILGGRILPDGSLDGITLDGDTLTMSRAGVLEFEEVDAAIWWLQNKPVLSKRVEKQP